MKKTTILSILAVLTLGMNFTSCKSDDADPIVETTTITVELPLNVKNPTLTEATCTITNVENQQVTTATASQFIKDGDGYVLQVPGLVEGTYNVELKGHLEFTANGVSGQKDFETKQENIKITQEAAKLHLTVSAFTAQGGFVFSEIFFTGTTTPEGKQYSNDQYVVITNNSDVTLYADSLAFVESSFNSTSFFTYVPDIHEDSLAVDAVYMIPGSGKDVPVEPGQSLTLAVNAINHTEGNANSFDLSSADYEFYDLSSNPNYSDVDNEKVPNLDKWFCYTATLYTMHSRGFKAMALVKLQGSKEEWLEKMVYVGNYQMDVDGDIYEMAVKNTYKIPVSWIIDGVNLSTKEAWEWNILPAKIDAGWTHCGETLNDKTRYGKSVIRKKDASGKYIDTNNSENDFEADATASKLSK